MSQKLDLSKLSAKQIAGLIELGVIDAPDSTSVAAPNGAFTPSDAHVEAYKGWITPREAYALLHPIAKKGTCTAKAGLNSLPVTGTVSVAGLKGYQRSLSERSGIECITDTETHRVYAQRTNKDGKTKDGRAPAFFKAGGQLVVDRVAKTASLRLPKGFQFSDEQIVALQEVIG